MLSREEWQETRFEAGGAENKALESRFVFWGKRGFSRRRIYLGILERSLQKSGLSTAYMSGVGRGDDLAIPILHPRR